MQNSSLHSFSLRLHFHAQYLQNKAYKHLMAKIFPEQLGYLTLPAPSRFPNASKALSRWGGGGGEVTHANPTRRSSLTPRSAATTRGTRAARARGGRQRGRPPTPAASRPASHTDGAPRAPPGPRRSPQRLESGGQPSAPEGGEGRSG